MLCDTDVLIWVLRGSKRAALRVEAVTERNLSVISYMELLQGARDRTELAGIKSLLADTGFEMVPLSENIGHRASIYVEEYGLKGAMCMADALIAATAVERQLVLCTANRKHYRLVRDLEISVFSA